MPRRGALEARSVDLVDQSFNSGEKRLARILLLMAEFGMPVEPETFTPRISKETLTETIGTLRSSFSYFMRRFRLLGLTSYNGRIQVHRALLEVVLMDHLPEHNADKLALLSDAAHLPNQQTEFVAKQPNAIRILIGVSFMRPGHPGLLLRKTESDNFQCVWSTRSVASP